MVPRAIGARDVLALPQSLVGDDLHHRANGPDRAGVSPESFPDLLFRGRPKRLAERLEHLPIVEPVVAADEAEHDLAVHDDGHRLRRRSRVDSEELGDVLDRLRARGLDLLGPLAQRELGRPRDAPRDLEIRRVVARSQVTSVFSPDSAGAG